MAGCVTLPPGAGFISSIMSYVDCQAEILGSGAWTALSAPGSTLTVVLAGFLTIFIALIGYNLLLGTMMTARESTLAFVKIGAVFALATSWPAYQTLVYDLAVNGPARLVAEIGSRAGVVGSDGTLLQRLDLTDQALVQLALLGTGTPTPGSTVQVPPPPFGGFDAFALGGSRILFLLTAVAGLGITRIIVALMLALGPLFIAFLMFDATRSLFEGWVRALAGVALAAVGVSIALGLQVALIEPWLSAALARRMAGEPLPTAPTELFVLTTLFMILALASVYACARVAHAFRLPLIARSAPVKDWQPRSMRAAEPVNQSRTIASANTERSRATAVANALAGRSRRESIAALPGSGAPFEPGRTLVASRESASAQTMRAVGRTFARRARSRVSARANRRDASA